MAEVLSRNGYATGAVVNNPFLHPTFGVGRGFHDYDYVPGHDHESRRADEMVTRSLAWVDEHSGRPFFLVLHLYDPHMNYDSPPPFRGRFTNPLRNRTRLSLPIANTPWIRSHVASLTEGDRSFISSAYDEEVVFVDQQVGRLLAALEQRGLLRSTLVLLTADHGEELFERDGFGHGHTLHEEVLRIPLLAWGGPVRPARLSTPVSLVDVAPTILEAAGLPPGRDLAGASLWATLTTGSEPPARLLFAERQLTEDEHKSVIRWPFQLVTDARGGRAQVFDLAVGGDVSADHADAYPLLRDELAARLREAIPPEGAGPDRPPVPLEEGLREKLHELGYALP
jgi:arylsulfatase A-like enzyme